FRLPTAASRRLMIDCALVGAGLTQRVNVIRRRRIGEVLRREGSITQAQLDEALKLARGTRQMLGEVLVELGYVDSGALSMALVAQGETEIGVLDALRADPLSDCVVETGVDRLSILPAGGAQGHHGAALSPLGVQRLIERGRGEEDGVLIDTGPVPGSLAAAAAVAAAVDGVVLAVSRGEDRGPAERC